MIGCDVLEPEDEPSWGRRRRRVATAEEIQRCVDNLELWVDQAHDERVRAEAERLDLLDEESIKLLLRRP
jgi:hypothetical protein